MIWNQTWPLGTGRDDVAGEQAISEKLGLGYSAFGSFTVDGVPAGCVIISFDLTTGKMLRRYDYLNQPRYALMTIAIDEITTEVHIGGYYQSPTLPVKEFWYILRNETFNLENYYGNSVWSFVHSIALDFNFLVGLVSAHEDDFGTARIFNLTAPISSQVSSSLEAQTSVTIEGDVVLDTTDQEVLIAQVTTREQLAKQEPDSRTSLISNFYFQLGIIFGPFLIIVAVVLCLCSLKRSKKKARSNKSKPASDVFSVTNTEPTTTVTSTGFRNESSTYVMTNMGLSIPAYKSLKFGIDFRAKSQLAEGGFGKILVAEVLNPKISQFGKEVIVKELTISNDQQYQLFQQEIAIMELFNNHKNIAKLIGYTERSYTIVMKFYRYGSLYNWIHSSQIKKKTLLTAFMIDVGKGIEVMHKRGLCHADLKPQNVLIDSEDRSNRLFCVLTDFGITKVFNSTSLLVSEFVPVNVKAASIAYAAPEVLYNFRRKGHQPSSELPFGDIYSFSIVMYEMICRGRPFAK